ncbi:glycosyl transferase [filamentous cyanobacterium CCP5]|nr:glycosyl transferase [filamentous cyanobacterium CCP5]
MAKPVLYSAITNHGFGHTTRAAAVAATVQQLLPEVELIVATTAPRWLLDCYIEGDFIHRQRAFDVGVIQADSIQMDLPATLEKLQHIQGMEAEWVAEESAFLSSAGVQLVLADIPPIAVSIAHAAGVPCWMMSNFGWDFIYRPWGGGFEDIADWISERFSQCDRLFRLPFHEPMAGFPVIEDVGLTGGDPRFDATDLRQKYSLAAPKEKTVLLTFGGLGLQQIPYEGLKAFTNWRFITFDRNAPDLPNLVKIQDPSLRPVDFMPLCGRAVSKPGFSTFSEACRQDVPIITITRDDFAEAQLLIDGMAASYEHRILEAEDFFEGSWRFLAQPLTPPLRPKQPLAKTGNQQIAQAVVDYLSAA